MTTRQRRVQAEQKPQQADDEDVESGLLRKPKSLASLAEFARTTTKSEDFASYKEVISRLVHTAYQIEDTTFNDRRGFAWFMRCEAAVVGVLALIVFVGLAPQGSGGKTLPLVPHALGLGCFATLLLVDAVIGAAEIGNMTSRRRAVMLTALISNSISVAGYAIATLAPSSVQSYPTPWAQNVFDDPLKYAQWAGTVPCTILIIADLTNMPVHFVRRATLGSQAMALLTAVAVTYAHASEGVFSVLIFAVCLVTIDFFVTLARAMHHLHKSVWPGVRPLVDTRMHMFVLVYFYFMSATITIIWFLAMVDVVAYDPFKTSFAFLDMAIKAVYAVLTIRTTQSEEAVISASLVFANIQQQREHVESHRRFLRFLSHEIRVPLSSLTMGLDLLWAMRSTSEPPTSDYGEGRRRGAASSSTDTIEAMQHSAEAMQAIVDDVLSLSRIEAGQLHLTHEPFNLASMIAHVQDGMHALASSKRVSIVCSCPNDLPTLIGDHKRLAQVLANLTANAVKFSPERATVKVDVAFTPLDKAVAFEMLASARDRIHTAARQSYSVAFERDTRIADEAVQATRDVFMNATAFGCMSASVVDSGCGIDPSEIGKLFKPFQQIRAGELQGGRGTGLGLAISRGIVEQHGGVIQCSSAGVGRGSTFTFSIPVAVSETSVTSSTGYASTMQHVARRTVSRTSALTGGPRDESVVPMLNGPSKPLKTLMESSSEDREGAGQLRFHVLVVDDVPSNSSFLARLLRVCVEQIAADYPAASCIAENLDIETACDGEDALRKVSATEARGYPFDLICLDKEMPVLDGYGTVERLRREGKKGFVLGVTGNAIPTDVAEFKAHGVDAVLTKPVRAASLRKAVQGLFLRSVGEEPNVSPAVPAATRSGKRMSVANSVHSTIRDHGPIGPPSLFASGLQAGSYDGSNTPSTIAGRPDGFTGSFTPHQRPSGNDPMHLAETKSADDRRDDLGSTDVLPRERPASAGTGSAGGRERAPKLQVERRLDMSFPPRPVTGDWRTRRPELPQLPPMQPGPHASRTKLDAPSDDLQ